MIRFNLKTVFLVFVVVASCLVLVMYLRKQAWSNQLMVGVESGDPCLINDTLILGDQRNLPYGWVDQALKDVVERGDRLCFAGFCSGFDLNHRIEGDYTAMMLATERGHYKIVFKLLMRGADPFLKNKQGCTALDLAEERGFANIVFLLNLRMDDEWQSFCDFFQKLELFNGNIANDIDYLWDGDIEKQLQKPKFARLARNKMDIELLPDEIIWFENSTSIAIGIDKDFRLRWMKDGLRQKFFIDGEMIEN